MSPKQLAYFYNRLQQWKKELLSGAEITMEHLKHEEKHNADVADRATLDADRTIELRERDRQRKLIAKIDWALERIKNGSYGYCEESGQPISLKRLIARPIATLSIEAQERHERKEKIYNQD